MTCDMNELLVYLRKDIMNEMVWFHQTDKVWEVVKQDQPNLSVSHREDARHHWQDEQPVVGGVK